MTDTLISWGQLVLGLVILIGAGEFIVRAATKLALYMRVSSVVIGLTVVSFGTSFPELVVSVDAALDGFPDISMGNVVGSNIANLALVLGVTALLFPLAVRRNSVVIDWPLMLVITVLLIGLAWDLHISRWEGILLFASIIGYNIYVIAQSRMSSNVLPEEEVDDDFEKSLPDLVRTSVIMVLSLGGLILGADQLVKGAVDVAKAFDVGERVIAITVIAFGTSAPELATSLIAVYRKEEGIGIGNLIGSNIFNILCILGATAIIEPISVNPSIKGFDFWFMLGIPLLIYPFILFKLKVGRLEGALLLLSYLVYIFLLF